MEYKIPKTFSTTCGLRSEKGGIVKPKNEKKNLQNTPTCSRASSKVCRSAWSAWSEKRELYYRRFKAESEAQRGKPKGALESEIRIAMLLLEQRPPRPAEKGSSSSSIY